MNRSSAGELLSTTLLSPGGSWARIDRRFGPGLKRSNARKIPGVIRREGGRLSPEEEG
jgi:hypothetical protein